MNSSAPIVRISFKSSILKLTESKESSGCVSESPNCPCGYEQFNFTGSIKCLKYVGLEKPELGRVCVNEHDGYLPLPLNDLENAEYFAAFNTFPLSTSMDSESPNNGNGVILGLYDLFSPGNYTTVTDEMTPLYFNWNTAVDEPDNGGCCIGGWHLRAENFVVMLTTAPESTPNALGTWNDFPGYEFFNLVCEADSI